MVRREGRRAALQLLYALDAGERWDRFEEQLGLFLRHLAVELTPEARELAEAICRRAVGHRGELDRLIEGASSNWRLERMNRVDRSILRLASAELDLASAPEAVILDEAIELAKEFGAPESPAFVNGVLNRIVKDRARGPR